MSKIASFLAVGIFVAVGSLAFAEEESVPTRREKVSENLSPNVGPVIAGSRLIGSSVSGIDDAAVGEVADLVIDPYYGKVAFLVISPAEEISNRGTRVLIPISLVTPIDKGHVSASVKAEKIGESKAFPPQDGSQPLTRRMSEATFRHYGVKPFWSDNVDSTDQYDAFVTLSRLKEINVNSSEGERLGQIDDVAISRKDAKVAYALFAHEHGKESKQRLTFAIPLAAFVASAKTGTWSLELPETLLDNTKSISADDLPEEVSRAWVEYVHVRYGRGVFDGAQRERKTAN